MYGVRTSELPEFDRKLVPAHECRAVGQSVFEAVQAAFQRPEVQEEFQRWLREREQEQKTAC